MSAAGKKDGWDAESTISVDGDAADPAPASVSNATYETGPEGDGPQGESPEDIGGGLTRGATVGRYLVLELLGAGAMGVAYAAYDPELDRKVALKLLRPQRAPGDIARRQARLVREAKAVAKVSHPNVVGIFDVGVHEGQVFMAMEYLAGGTLRDWMAAKKRPWREVVQLFIEVGKGLVGAHAEGLIHRDFKPDNVLLDKNGVPKVVDFGLVRMSAGETDLTGSGASDRESSLDGEGAPHSPPKLPGEDVSLTRTGTLLGTPAYMAPEQFLGKPVEARTDQFALCVTLYEALYGERPFAGDTAIALAGSVANGEIRAAPKGADVPTWVRTCVTRGLRVAPSERYANVEQLLAALANDPVSRRRRRLLVAVASSMVILAVLGTRHLVLAKRRDIDRQAAEHIALADSLLRQGEQRRAESKRLRDDALAAFDGFERDKGEELWATSLADAKAAESAYGHGIQRLEAAFALTPGRQLKARIANALVDSIPIVDRTEPERDALLRRLETYDDGGERLRRLARPATLRLATSPPGLEARLEPYDPVTHRPSTSDVPREVGRTPLTIELPPGSYRLTFAPTSTHVGFHYPVLLGAGETVATTLTVPPASEVPKDFAYVPAGRFLFGSADEDIRAVFLETTPLHAVSTKAYLISKYETTIGDWIAFLDALPDKERERLRPQAGGELRAGFVDIRRSSAGWKIGFRATEKLYRAGEGTPFVYSERDHRASQNWLRFPVTGISPQDAMQYAAWLDRSGRVPKARLCTEREWERAARGADAREFPHGDRLLRDDANFDLTYARRSAAFGPDEVGSHPVSVSPFGVFDLTGNAWEITTAVIEKDQFVARGGSFYQNLRTLLIPNRDPFSAVSKDHTVGLRICADPQS